MSAHDDGSVETVDVKAEVQRRVAAKLAEHGIKERPSDGVINAELNAAQTPEELQAVCEKHGMLQ